MAKHDHWPTKAEAARRLDTSIRNIERLIARGDIESSKRTQPGRKPITIVNPDDLARMQPPAHVMPPETGATGETQALQRATLHQQTAAAFSLTEQQLAALLQHIATIATGPAGERVDTKRWLTPAEAAALSGLSEPLLRRLIKAGELFARRDGREWKIRREDLDKL